ncbi:MAG: Carotenogenesis protein CarS [Archangium sp.]
MLPEEMTGMVVRRNVRGAPLQLDTRVFISEALDDTGDPRFAGRVGMVSGYVYDCPAEQYPHRPMVLVSVEGLGEEVFFAEELRVLTSRKRRATISASA